MALPVETNPYIVHYVMRKEQERRINLASHRLEIEGIYHWGKPLKEEVFDSIRLYCAGHRIEFGLREFKGDVFWQDRECIVQLPAFHVYYDEEYEKTFYLEDNPSDVLEDILNQDRPAKRTTMWFPFPSFKWGFPKKKKMLSSA